jgi:hypothetical protein
MWRASATHRCQSTGREMELLVEYMIVIFNRELAVATGVTLTRKY